MLIQSGTFAIEQLSEAMSVKAGSYKISEEITQSAVRKCAKQVCTYQHIAIICVFSSSVMVECVILFSINLRGPVIL